MKHLSDFWTEKGVDAATTATLKEYGLDDRAALEGVTARDLKDVYGIAPAMIARVIASRTEYDKWLAAATAPINLGTTEDALTALALAPTNPEVLAATEGFRQAHGFLPSVDPAQPFDVAATIEAYAWVAGRPGRRLPAEWKGSTGVPAKFRTWAELFPSEKGRFHPRRPSEELSPASPLYTLDDDALLALHYLAADGKLWSDDDDEDLVERVAMGRSKYQGALAEVARLKAAGGADWLRLLARLHGEAGTPATPPFVSSPVAPSRPPTDGEFWAQHRLWGDHPAWGAPLSAYVNGSMVDGLAAHIALRLRLQSIYVSRAALARFVTDFAASVRALAVLRGNPEAAHQLTELTIDELEGSAPSSKILSLIQYCQRRRHDRALWLAVGGLDDMASPPPPAPPPNLTDLVEIIWPYANGSRFLSFSDTVDLAFVVGYDAEDFGAKTAREMGKALVRQAELDGKLGQLIKNVWTERGILRPGLIDGGWDRLL